MKYIKTYKVFESSEDIDIISFLEINCHKFLDEIRTNCLLYRGYNTKDTDQRITDGVYIKTTRTDRKPVSTTPQLHDEMNQKFFDIYGERLRSEAVFTSTDKSSSWMYGDEYLFFPIGEYKYYWNPEVTDLYVQVLDMSDFNKFANGYISDNIGKANRSEVMFVCKEYYLVDSKYEDEIRDYLFSRTIKKV